MGSVGRTKEEVVEEFRCQAIREAAMRVVGRKGLASATVQEIADEAGVAKGTVYLYFRSREEILEQARTSAVDELLDRLRQAIAEGGDFRTVLERVLSTQIAYFDAHQNFFRLVLAQGEEPGERRLRRHASYHRHVSQLATLIAAAAERGEVRAADPERLAVAIAGAARDLILRRIDERTPPPVADDVRLLADLICRGVAAGVRRPRQGPKPS